MKRIQFIITGLGSGGAERQLIGLATMLKERDYIIQVCWYTNVNFYESILVDAGIECKRLYTSNHLKKIFNIKRNRAIYYVQNWVHTVCKYPKVCGIL